MDADLKQAESHIILPVERLGDTLLVTPHGDLGSYSVNTFHAEFRQVQKLVAQPRIKNLIVDLSGSRYFGSEMMGALLALREPIVEGGGRAALVNVSEDTKVGLSLVKADELFEVMGTRSEAIRKVAHQTIGDRVHRNRHALRVCAALFLLAVGGWWLYASKLSFQILGSRSARTYEEIARKWQRYEAGRVSWTHEEDRVYSDQFVDELISVDKSLKREHLFPVPEDHFMTLAVNDFLSVIRGTTADDEMEFLRNMQHARYQIIKRTGLDVPLLRPAHSEGGKSLWAPERDDEEQAQAEVPESDDSSQTDPAEAGQDSESTEADAASPVDEETGFELEKTAPAASAAD